jgi:hypothetical protein
MRNRAIVEHARSSSQATPTCQEYHHTATAAFASSGMKDITWAKVPRRCKKLFRRAFTQYDDSGLELVITQKD